MEYHREDGHIIDGEYGFTVTKANANKESTESPTKSEEDKSQTIEEPEKASEQAPAASDVDETLNRMLTSCRY
ncbi:hypothetical protein GTW56_29935 [Bacillus sp. EB93]|nr:hypothetical protein [Peribacillus frigoritolerans]